MADFHSSVRSYQRQQDEKNMAQKAGLQFKTVEILPDLLQRMERLEDRVRELEEDALTRTEEVK